MIEGELERQVDRRIRAHPQGREDMEFAHDQVSRNGYLTEREAYCLLRVAYCVGYLDGVWDGKPATFPIVLAQYRLLLSKASLAACAFLRERNPL